LSNSEGGRKPWPNGENGEPIPPVYLTHIGGGPMDQEMMLGLLDAYGIPHVEQYPNNGLFGKLVAGYPPSGVEVFVPETMFEDAQNILNAEVVEDDSDANDFDEESGE